MPGEDGALVRGAVNRLILCRPRVMLRNALSKLVSPVCSTKPPGLALGGKQKPRRRILNNGYQK